MSVAKILIADSPIPSPGYGSWTQRVDYLLTQYDENVFDYVICSESQAEFHSTKTKRYNCDQHTGRLMNKLVAHWRFRHYKKALKEISKKHDQLLICIVDSKRLKHAVWQYINDLGIIGRTRLVYYQCGYSTYLTADQYERLTEGVGHFIYLTENAYQFELEHNPSLPFTAYVLHNPIDHNRFYIPNPIEKKALRNELQMDNGLQLIWASQDRPKKGLEVVLQAWQKFYHPHLHATLHVVGANRTDKIPGVVFHGRIPSYNVHKYLKAADIGVFSALWTEGFGLTLAEQISCGLLCIASVAGGVAEYFKPGLFGIPVHRPNMKEEWVIAFQQAIEMLPSFLEQQKERREPPFLTYDEWCKRFCQIFTEIESYEF